MRRTHAHPLPGRSPPLDRRVNYVHVADLEHLAQQCGLPVVLSEEELAERAAELTKMFNGYALWIASLGAPQGAGGRP